MTTIGIIGAGNIGSNVAKAAIAAGHSVVIANSRGPETLTALIGELGPNAQAATVEQAAAAGDLVLVAVPLKNVTDLPAEFFDGRVVMDANNYYPQRDGRIGELDDNSATTSELVQRHLAGASVVKIFNNIFAKDIPAHGLPAGSPGRRALPLFGDDADAKRQVAEFVDSLGFDAVDLGTLDESWRVERDTPAYVVRTEADDLRDLALGATRVQQT